MNYLAKLGLNILIFTCILSTIDGQDVCVKKGPCRCEFSNGTGIDLSPVAKGVFFSSQIFVEKKDKQQIELSTYFYHPCYDAVPPINATSPNNTCNRTLSICCQVYTLNAFNTSDATYKMDPGMSNYLGMTDNSTFNDNGDAITYGNGPSSTTVRLVCAESDDKLHITSLAEPNAIILSLYSKYACLRQLDVLPVTSGRSLGSTLLIIFFSFVIFYLVLGVCTKKFLMGATGVEVIPNLAFWSDLPNLIKDGWAFALAGFKLPVRGSGPAMSPDPNSYDSI